MSRNHAILLCDDHLLSKSIRLAEINNADDSYRQYVDNGDSNSPQSNINSGDNQGDNAIVINHSKETLIPSSTITSAIPNGNVSDSFSSVNSSDAPDSRVVTVYEDDGLLELLKSWKLESHFISFYECGVKYADIQYLNQNDIGEMFPGRENIGLRARLREHLFFWKKSQGISQCSTVNDSGVCEWLEKCREFFKPEPLKTNSPSKISSKITSIISVREILQSSDMGRNVIQYYDIHGMLDEKKRDDIISCIVEHFFDPVLKTYKVPDPKTMNKLAEGIINIFPKENLDIYYIPRNKNRNPTGRLFNKFIRLNRKSKGFNAEIISKKQRTSDSPFEQNDINYTNDESKQDWQELASNEDETDTEIEILKNKVQLVSEKDNSAHDIWARSYSLRRKEIMNNNNSLNKILLDWPYFKSAVGDTYIDYDFGVEYRKSQLSLFQKWDNLITELRPIFLEKIKDKHYKLLYNNIILNKFDKDTANYIQIAALNCILRPTLRHHHKKTSIKDAVNSMVTHLYAVNDLERLKFEKQNEASSSKSTIQPFILVVGPSPTNIKEFYIILDKFTLKFNSFLTALDICFKCFQVFNLTYPKESELVWQWIQNYIYEIKTENDKKSSALAELNLILKK